MDFRVRLTIFFDLVQLSICYTEQHLKRTENPSVVFHRRSGSCFERRGKRGRNESPPWSLLSKSGFVLNWWPLGWICELNDVRVILSYYIICLHTSIINLNWLWIKGDYITVIICYMVIIITIMGLLGIGNNWHYLVKYITQSFFDSKFQCKC